ncbi:hypothetical protein AHMF7605_26135 [Adhaeribacter arboris]|uniref:Uncharacterized protein n=1 Tax=Adhaeribacter arboris TaxID=2072846 RepID=A0A2T2YMK4_9BACT|nr:hypothetical protein [Adhaeribacter arboris]PSR56725.1 hypothetical protein AHMF7605_26135 [Adhaeribacter arboris]
MKDTTCKGQPLLVLNPETNRYLNIQPLTHYLKERCANNPAYLAERFENTIRFVSQSFDRDTEPLDLKNTLGFLFEMKDVFSNLAEYKSTGHEHHP